jgi:hypothetical protein
MTAIRLGAQLLLWAVLLLGSDLATPGPEPPDTDAAQNLATIRTAFDAWQTGGSQRALTRMIGRALTAGAVRHLEPVTAEWLTDQARKAIATVSETRSTWQRHHVLAEAQRIVRSTGHAWRSSGGRVIWLAPQAIAAIELGADL